jgi:hypothetical protein
LAIAVLEIGGAFVLLCNVVEILLILQIICSLILHFFYDSLLGLVGISLFSINICEVLVVFN